MSSIHRNWRAPVLLALVALCLRSGKPAPVTTRPSLWRHDNLIAWTVVPFDAKARAPEARAAMLEGLGFKHFAYDWRDKDISTFDAEIDALEKHGINLIAWWYPFNATDAQAKATLEVFKRHNVHPQLWVPQFFGNMPKTPQEWAQYLPKGVTVKSGQEFAKLSATEKAAYQRQMHNGAIEFMRSDLPKTPQEQRARVRREADRIRALVDLASPYGCKVELYNHNGWFGMEENQLAIIGQLKELGVTGVGMVYNFSHARDELHDDSGSVGATGA